VKQIVAAGRPIIWRRLDMPGHDAATFRLTDNRAELRGMAVFYDEAGPTSLSYRVHSDASWRTTDATVEGWSGTKAVDIWASRDSAGGWTLNGVPYPAVSGCVDLDLSFTPATNLLPLRRLELAVGDAAEVRSAWLEWPAAVLSPLIQRYARRSATEYDYEADLPGDEKFVAVLRVDSSGWVVDYGDLWQAEVGKGR
jgi:uncharacterized protein